MFPISDPTDIRQKLEALCPKDKGARSVHFSYAPLIFTNGGFWRIPMVNQGNVARVDDDGVLLHMGDNADPKEAVLLGGIPVIPPTIGASTPYFSSGLLLRVPYSAIIDVWEDTTSTKLVNLWLRGAVVMAQGWTFLPFIWPPELVSRPGGAR